MEQNLKEQRRALLGGTALCILVALSLFFFNGGVRRVYGPDVASLEKKRQALAADKNALLLAASRCRNARDMTTDAYICPSSAVIYESTAGGDHCRMVEELLQDLGLSNRLLRLKPDSVKVRAEPLKF